MPDFIPRGDADFNNWQANLLTQVNDGADGWGIPADNVAVLTDKQTVWAAAYGKANNRQNRTPADVQAKDDSRKDYTSVLRSFNAQWLANNSRISDADRERMGLTVKSGTRTATSVPSTSPAGSVDFSNRLRHTIHFYDEATPHTKAKPAGVHGCEIWAKVGGEAPKAASELAYLATDTATPYVLDFDGADAGKTVYYWLRWVNSRNQQGPWGRMFSATVVG